LPGTSNAFPEARVETSQPSGFRYLAIGGLQLELVQADEKVPSGAAGSVVYWAVEDFDRALTHFQLVGAKLYRGPMEIDAAEWMAQLRDPWGNCFGIRGRKEGWDGPKTQERHGRLNFSLRGQQPKAGRRGFASSSA
jgi:predicted enzyme related to lactoylglutathione lyase